MCVPESSHTYQTENNGAKNLTTTPTTQAFIGSRENVTLYPPGGELRALFGSYANFASRAATS